MLRRKILTFAAFGLVCVQGCRRDPRAPLRLAAGVEHREFVLDLPHDRVLFLRGEYPRKTYLCAEALTSGGPSASFRLPGFSLIGGLYAMRDGGVLLLAQSVADGDASGGTVLKVDVASENIIASYGLKNESLRAFAQPSWSTVPVAVVQDDSGLSVAGLSAGADLARGVPLAAGSAKLLAVDENYPAIAAAAWDRAGRGALRLLDPVTGHAGREVQVRAPGYLASRGDGHWLVALDDEDDSRSTVVDFDATLSRAVPLFSSAGPVESVVAGKRWLFAVSLSTAARPAGDPRWLRPREVHRVDLSGVEPEVSFSWTKRQGRLLGLDESKGRLYYAVTDHDDPAVWSIDISSESLRGAAAAVDSSRRISWGLVEAITLASLLAGLVILILWALIAGPRS